MSEHCVICGKPFEEWQRRHPVFDADSDRAGEAHPACAGIREPPIGARDNSYSVKLESE
jgi:hypothetical protein